MPQRVSFQRAESRANLMRDLRRTPPVVVVVERGDVMREVTGNTDDSLTTLGQFAELNAFLSEGYRLVDRIGDFDILQAKPR